MSRFALAFALVAASSSAGCGPPGGTPPDDEAMVQARKKGQTAEQAAAKFHPYAYQNYFQGMDAAASAATIDALADVRPPEARELRDPVSTPSEIFGRNTWMLWCGGNEGFWDDLARNSLGFIDLVKLVDSRRRTTRFHEAGLINEPDRTQASEPAEEDSGLWFDQPIDADERIWRRCYLRRALDREPKGRELRRRALEDGCSDDALYALYEDALAKSTRPAEPPAAPTPAEEPYPSPEAPAGEAYPVPAQQPYAAGGTAGGYGALPRGEIGKYYGKYDDPQIAALAYALEIPPPEIYGLSSGVIGLRLFPNPDFGEKARKQWDSKRYQSDEIYFNDPDLELPYRVGMSCAFCHASYHPLKPPRDLVNPANENLSGNIGAQYLRIRAVFGNLLKPEEFVYHLLDSHPPGTVDTSLIASDNINNPNTMNAVFGVPARVVLSLRLPPEKLGAAAEDQPSLWRHPDLIGEQDTKLDAPTQQLREHLGKEGVAEQLGTSNGDPRRVPRILLDGSDSIGAWGALARVYLNIGTYWEQWNRLHEVVIGFRPQRPFRIDDAESHSVYWHATQERVGPLRDYFLKATPTMPLLAAEHGDPKPLVDPEKLWLGRQAFARNCIACHSSEQPDDWWADKEARAAEGILWERDAGRWLSDPEYLDWAKREVEKPEFWSDNYLSTDFRVPVTLVGTNACRALGTNALTGQMWEDFASDSYRKLPSVGAIRFWNPYEGAKGEWARFEPQHRTPPGAPPGGGGPGYYRVPTLLSIWATAPFLHNNSLGLFNNDPSVEGRLEAFEDAMRKLLWPEQRRGSSSYNEATATRLEQDGGLIWRTTSESYLRVALVRVPFLAPLRRFFVEHEDNWLISFLRPLTWEPAAALLAAALVVLLRARRKWTRRLGHLLIVLAFGAALVFHLLNGRLGALELGPIPKGTPVNLLANLNPDAGPRRLLGSLAGALRLLAEGEYKRLPPEEVARMARQEIAPKLLEVSRCPDLVMDRGHEFEWFKGMTDREKEALIELLKTL